MKTSKWCNNELNSSAISIDDIKDELDEFIQTRTFEEFKEEFSDVLYFTYSYLEQKTGVSLPMFGAMKTVRKVEQRINIWREIFEANGLVFDKKYLVNGSNFQKQFKVDKALELARVDRKMQMANA